MTDSTISTVQWGVVLGLCLVAAIWDLTQRRVPNALVLPVFLAGLVWNTWVGGIGGLGSAFVGAVLLSVPYVFLFATVNGGAGDAKLMAAIGAWLGIATGLVALVAVAVVGVVVGVAVAIRKKQMSTVFIKMADIVWWMAGKVGLTRQASPKPELNDGESIGTMPYAVVVALGVCIAGTTCMLWQK